MSNFFKSLKKNSVVQFILCLFRSIYFFQYSYYSKKFKFKILDPLSTVESIRDNKVSIARFGDGEFNIAFKKKGTGFQSYDENLGNDLLNVLRFSKEKSISLGIPHGYTSTKLDKFRVKTFWWSYITRNNHSIRRFVSESQRNEFLDASFTRVITEVNDRDLVNRILDDTKKIWKGKNVLIVEGAGTGFGSGNDLLKETNSVSRIIAPAVNAYSKIDKIRKSIKNFLLEQENLDNVIVLYALGPTATILASDFSSVVQSIDIGHLDLQYEYLKKGFYKRVKINNKYDNEMSDGDQYNIKDDEYQKEIIDSII